MRVLIELTVLGIMLVVGSVTALPILAVIFTIEKLSGVRKNV